MLASLSIGALCLWGIASWQNISRGELLTILLGTVVMLGTIMLAALAIITVFKLVTRTLFGSAEQNENSVNNQALDKES